MENIVPFCEYHVEKQGAKWALIRKSHVISQVLNTYNTRSAAEAAKRKIEKKKRKNED